MLLRDSARSRLRNGTFDVLVAGAGINGAATAAALVAHGLSVALVDRGDFGGETSQESSNLVWGGIKYLENQELALVRDLCRSRNELLRSYPANVREIRFYTAVEKGFRYPPWMLFAGTWAYWGIGSGFTHVPRYLTRGRIGREEPLLRKSRFRGGVEYSDAYLIENDARFVFHFVRDAAARGAVVANYVGVREAAREPGGHWRVRLVDEESGNEIQARARVLVNAAGPWIDDLNRQIGLPTSHRHVFSKGIHLVVGRIASQKRIFTFFDRTGRLFFVLPMGNRSVVGTTDTREESPDVRVTDEDRQFLLDHVNERLALERPLTREDIVAERCGVRPLVIEKTVGSEGQDWLSLSRRHVLEVDEGRRAVSLFGGKLTDCLNVGRELVEIVRHLGLRPVPPAHGWFGEPPESVAQELDDRVGAFGWGRAPEGTWDRTPGKRLWRRHGLDAFAVLDRVERDPEAAVPVIEGTPYSRAEIAHARDAEMVVRLEDFLRRRTKTALLIPHETLAGDPGVLDACRVLFGNDARRRYRQYFGADAPLPKSRRRRIFPDVFRRTK